MATVRFPAEVAREWEEILQIAPGLLAMLADVRELRHLLCGGISGCEVR